MNCVLSSISIFTWGTIKSTAYEPSCVSYDTVRHWKKKFESNVDSIKMHRNQVGRNLHLVKKSLQK